MLRLVLMIFFVTAPAFGQGLIAPYQDEAAQDPDFAAWRAELMLDVISRDAEAVASKAASDIKLSFGGDEGRETFAHWLQTGEGITEKDAETYWRALEATLALGGTFADQNLFVAPYIFNVELPDENDPYTTYAVLGHKTPLYEGPDDDTPVLDRLTGDMVVIIEDDNKPGPYSHVVLSDGREGYIQANRLRSIIDFRAFFVRRDDTWQMTVFIAGD